MEVSTVYEKTCGGCGSTIELKYKLSLKVESKCCKACRNTKKLLNEDFFRVIDCEENAYLLGLLQTDGNLRRPKGKNNSYRITLKLQQKDTEIVKRLSDILFGQDFTRTYFTPSSQKQGNTQPAIEICFHSETMGNDLINLGVVPNKTYSLKMPEPLMNTLLRDSVLASHWFRGVLDGDGCFTLSKTGQPSLELYSISPEFVDQSIQIVRHHTGMDMHMQKKYGKLVGLRIGGVNQVHPIVEWLYAHSTIHFDRKKEKAFQSFAAV